jgi:hypothetical protein
LTDVAGIVKKEAQEDGLNDRSLVGLALKLSDQAKHGRMDRVVGFMGLLFTPCTVFGQDDVLAV